jgi:hypothetical protein
MPGWIHRIQPCFLEFSFSVGSGLSVKLAPKQARLPIFLFNFKGDFSMTTRRVFMMQSVLGASALASGVAMAAAPMVAETDANAKGLGYVADSAKADAKKYPKHAATQMCSNCALYQGKAGAASGGCPLFAGKEVAAKGWCSAYAKKA